MVREATLTRVRGFVLQPTQRIREGRFSIRLAGVLESGTGFVVEDDRFRPAFYVREADAEAVRARLAHRGADAGFELEPTPRRSLSGEPLMRVRALAPGPLRALRDQLEVARVELFEADLRPTHQFLIERGLGAEIAIEGVARTHGRVTWFRNPELSRAEFRPRLSVLSLDIETLPDASRVLSVALVGCGASEVHWVGSRVVEGAHAHADERALLARVVERIGELDPDVLTGWNVVDFDLRVLAERSEACGVRFEIGRTPDRVYFRRDEGFTRQSRAEVSGRQVLDALGLVRDSFVRLEDYRLETAAQHILGRGKRIEHGVRDAAQEILRLYREAPDAFVRYNLEDARLVLDILADQALIELAVERSALTGMQLDRVGASIASFDQVYLPALHAREAVAPSVQRDRKSAPVRGGAVLDSTPGYFHNVAVFDFKSLYPSLIRTFNLDPWSHARAATGSDPLAAPNGARFARERGILPEILEAFAARRDAAKQRGDRHADVAIKLLMNSFFGVLGSASCRFFDAELANAITSFGQQTLLTTRLTFERFGARVLYGDTDSIFVELGGALDPGEATRQATALRDRVQRQLSDDIRARHRVEPQLELELDQLYARFFQPSVRGGTKGSKKRYAGLVGHEVEVVGLEAVRRDWPEIAKQLQVGLLERVFTDRPALPFVAETVRALKAGELDAALVVRKRLRKGAIDRYTKQTPAHVEAARRSGARRAREIAYVITTAGPEAVDSTAELGARRRQAPIDYAHYVERVLRPVADTILRPLGQSFDQALGRPRQLTLL